jgi:hypothetical protein
MQISVPQYTLQDCLWDFIQFAGEKKVPHQWISRNRHEAKLHLSETLENCFNIRNAEDFMELVCAIRLQNFNFTQEDCVCLTPLPVASRKSSASRAHTGHVTALQSEQDERRG